MRSCKRVSRADDPLIAPSQTARETSRNIIRSPEVRDRQCNTVFASTSKTRAVARMPSPSAKQASTRTIRSTAACLP
jgi:hypothetical protein